MTSKHGPSIPSPDHETRPSARSTRSASASSTRIANSLVAIGSASVLVIYAAGYWRTRAAAERIERASSRRAAPIEAPAPTLETPRAVAPAAETAPNATNELARADVPVQSTAAPAAAAPKPVVSAVSPTQSPVTRSTAVAVAAAAPSAPVVETKADALPQTSSAVTAPTLVAPIESDATSTAPVTLAPAIAATDVAAKAAGAYKDGTYTGWGTCRHGDIEATVVVASGRITSATISQCLTRYPCSWIQALPPQVVQRQSAEVDYVSGATQSADAFYGAVVAALSKAK